MRHLLHDGIFLREFGADENAPTVLWIHGLGESGLCFETVLDHGDLAGGGPFGRRGRWRHLVPDLPGYGRTAWPGSPAPLADLAELLADLSRETTRGELVVAGHSMGGVIALLLAERFPSLVRGVIDIDGNKNLGDCTYSSQAAALPLQEFIAGGFASLRDEVYSAGLHDLAQRSYYASLRQADPASFHRHSEELVALSRRGDLALRLAALGCPKVYVAGFPGGACLESRRSLAAARVPVIEIAPSGHWPFLDQPQAFAGAVAAFLAEMG